MSNTMQNAVSSADVKFIGDLVLQDEVIPIIGYDLMYTEHGNGVREEFVKSVIQNIEDQGLKDVCSEFAAKYPLAPANEVINYAYHLFDIKQKKRFNFAFSRAINKVRAEAPVFLDPFIKLAQIKNFRLYVNATCANVMEIAINAYRSSDKKEGYEVYSPLKPDGKDLPNPAHKMFQNRYSLAGIEKPTVYNLFGTHNTNSKYLLTDVEFVDLLVELLNTHCFCPNFKSYLSQSSLLFIGCNFSEWFLRFFTRFWAGPQMDERLATQYNVLIDSLNQSEFPDRAFFLSNFKIKALGTNSIEFINALYQYISENSQEAKPSKAAVVDPAAPVDLPQTAAHSSTSIIDDVYNNYVMISYNTLDQEAAILIRDILNKNNIRVWMDLNHLQRGDNLDDVISKTVGRSSLVVQVVSGNFQKRTDSDPYFLREWALIINQNKFRIPFFVDDVSENAIVPDTLQKYKDVIKQSIKRDTLAVYFDKANPVIPESAISKIRDMQYQSLVKDLKFKPA
ncbi:toll/interleukin-1 receptor domain-containing protein [Chryseolinea sp. T2]|uniref:toll/interleukin-1 receptor domain-containing protein n=1 Tax=Chryseolinea sp. T2 TaxID=3129255 RepID=UPI00307793B7